MKTIKYLWLLQQIEKKERELLATCRVNPVVKDLKKYKEEILLQQQAFEKAKKSYQDLTETIKSTEAEIKLIMDKQKEILKKLYDGSVSNSKELTKMQQQSQQLKEKALEYEEKQLKDMEEKERVFTYLKQEQESLKNQLENYKKQKMHYEIEKINLEQEIAQLGEEKERIIAEIPEQLLNRFRSLQKTFNQEPISYVGPNRICTSCNVEIIRSVVDKALQQPGKVSCESCGSIIYFEQ